MKKLCKSAYYLYKAKKENKKNYIREIYKNKRFIRVINTVPFPKCLRRGLSIGLIAHLMTINGYDHAEVWGIYKDKEYKTICKVFITEISVSDGMIISPDIDLYSTFSHVIRYAEIDNKNILRFYIKDIYSEGFLFIKEIYCKNRH